MVEDGNVGFSDALETKQAPFRMPALKDKIPAAGIFTVEKRMTRLKKSGATGAWALSKARFDTDEMPIQTLDREEVPYYGNHYIIYIYHM